MVIYEICPLKKWNGTIQKRDPQRHHEGNPKNQFYLNNNLDSQSNQYQILWLRHKFHLKLKHEKVRMKIFAYISFFPILCYDLLSSKWFQQNILNNAVIYMRSQDYTWTTMLTSIFPPTLIIRVTMTFSNITLTITATYYIWKKQTNQLDFLYFVMWIWILESEKFSQNMEIPLICRVRISDFLINNTT